jgi:hypothetical protein
MRQEAKEKADRQPEWRPKKSKNPTSRPYLPLPPTLTAASMAKTYEFRPNPQIWPQQTGAMSDLCRNSSRAWTLDRWISMVGTPVAEIASLKAMLVCV